jgi:hypothetical protein
MAIDGFAIRKELVVNGEFESNGIISVVPKAGTPESSITAGVGSLCLDTTNGKLYLKKTGTGNTGWSEIETGSLVKDWKDSVKFATTEALNASAAGGPGTGAEFTAAGSGVGKTLTCDIVGVWTIDGQALTVGDRILVKDSVDVGAGDSAIENGIYTVTTVGAVGAALVLTRATDFDEDSEVTSACMVPVEGGTANPSTGWIVTTADPITVDTTAINFTLAFGTGLYTAGDGIDISSNVISADLAADGGLEIDTGEIAINVDATTNTTEINAANELAVVGKERNTHTTVSTDVETVDSVATATYNRSVWNILVINGTGRMGCTITAITDGTLVDADQSAITYVNKTSFTDKPKFDVSISGANLLLTVDTDSGAVVKFTRESV